VTDDGHRLDGEGGLRPALRRLHNRLVWSKGDVTVVPPADEETDADREERLRGVNVDPDPRTGERGRRAWFNEGNR